MSVNYKNTLVSTILFRIQQTFYVVFNPSETLNSFQESSKLSYTFGFTKKYLPPPSELTTLSVAKH